MNLNSLKLVKSILRVYFPLEWFRYALDMKTMCLKNKVIVKLCKHWNLNLILHTIM